MKQLQRVGQRANRYDHTSEELADGRWVMSCKGAEHDTGCTEAAIRSACERQRKRWAAGVRRDGEKPIEVLCRLHPVTRKRGTVLLDVDALRAALL